MNKTYSKIFLMALILSAALMPAVAFEKLLLTEIGTCNGTGGSIGIALDHLNAQYPAGIEFGGGFFWQGDPGNAEEARKIFINDNTGGDIEEHGTTTMLYLNGTYAIKHDRDIDFSLYAGPRYSWYRAFFKFNGDNEEFTVKHDTFGFGFGGRGKLTINEKVDLTLRAGIDYYFENQLHGHGEYTYNPDDSDDNPRNDYTYDDADGAVEQPDLEFILQVGLSFKLDNILK